MNKTVLASSSPYCRALLDEFKISFYFLSPDIDDTSLAGEDMAQMVQRLATAKTQALAEHYLSAACLMSRSRANPLTEANTTPS